MFQALVLDLTDDGPISSIRRLDDDVLPAGDVTVAVEYSGLNYKDGMVLNGLGKLVRDYPHVPGIDLAGTVTASEHPDFRAGDPVVLTGWGVGERHWGGFAEKARVKGDWLVPLPAGLTTRQAMVIGTAGLAAMLGILALEDHGLGTGAEPVLVTGATGGVGSLAVALLAGMGYRVAASTGRPEENRAYLQALGAAEVLDRHHLEESAGGPLEHQRWGGCIDSVGGPALARILAQTAYGGSVAAVGLAGGADLHTSVIPFLLRGVSLLGIDTVFCPTPRRRQAWDRLQSQLTPGWLESLARDATLGEVPELGRRILHGDLRGRTVVDVRR
jgi:acrylyl-CoA reductase (NADPH)